jgi:glucose-6-phosphate 1-dehydrogenase
LATTALRPPPDCDIVVVGISGDLAARKLIPALYNLSAEGLLPKAGDIIGVAPVDWTDEALRDHARDAVKQFSRTGLDDKAFTAFAKRLRFVAPAKDGGLAPLQDAVSERPRLVYLAVPASAFGSLIKSLQKAGLADGTSVIIEKPFGHDSASAAALNKTLHRVFPEPRIFRIDHYLGKETVQNMLVLRFGNSLFERVWNRDAVARVEITVAESIGVGHRGRFYEETGAIRDIVQNHMFQVLAVTAMEPPTSFAPEAIRNEKVKVIGAIHPIHPSEVVRGQYRAGRVDGEKVPGYREEDGVGNNSTTETYAALRLHVDTWRWSGVPFLLRTGKRLKQQDTRIVITFRDVPLKLFRRAGVHSLDSNRMVVRIQPDEGIAVTFVAKQPGPTLDTRPVRMDFDYSGSFQSQSPEAYERLLHDALIGDHTLFIREDEVEEGWKAVQPVLDAPPKIVPYAAGSWGPEEADRLIRPGHWHDPDDPT